MKVKVEFTIEIDAEAYASDYGIPLAEVREVVKRDSENWTRTHFEAWGIPTGGSPELDSALLCLMRF